MAKRLFDIFFSILGLVVLCPLMFAVAMGIKFDSKGPIFFRQDRVGKDGVPFRIHKFRTMRHTLDDKGSGITIGDDERITRFGRHIRAYKLDELPQLIDVLRGKMSFVGPRPELEKFVLLYSNDSRKIILSVRPGITDYASVMFANEASILEQSEDPLMYYVNEIMPKKIELAEKYVRSSNVATDIYILVMTFLRIFLKSLT